MRFRVASKEAALQKARAVACDQATSLDLPAVTLYLLHAPPARVVVEGSRIRPAVDIVVDQVSRVLLKTSATRIPFESKGALGYLIGGDERETETRLPSTEFSIALRE